MMRNIAVVLSGRDAGLARTLGAASGALLAFDKSVTGMGTRASKVMGGLKFALQAVAVAAAVALGAAVVAAVKFEGAMRNVNSILQLGQPQFEALSASVLEMSTRLPESATNLAKGLYDIVSSGFEAADALKILEVSSTAASAGLTTTATASKVIVGVLNAYGLEAEDASHVSDVLFKTVELGVITFEELAMQLGEVNAGAAAAGISVEEVGGAIATMTLSGLQANEATTSLNRLIRELISPTDELRTALKNVGIENVNTALRTEGLHGVMEKLRIATGGQIGTLQKLFPEIRAARGAFALMTAGGTVYARVMGEMNDKTQVTGATQRAFNEQMKGLGKQFEVFKNQVTAAGIAIGAKLIPVLRSAMQAAQSAGPRVVDFFKNIGQAAKPAFEAVGDAVKQVVRLFQTLVDVAGPVIRTMAGMTFMGAIAGLTALAKAFGMVAGFLADHPALVAAVAAIYGSVLVGRLLTAAAAFIRLQAGMVALRLGLFGLVEGTMMASLATLATRLAGIGVAAGTFLTGNFAGAGIAFAASIRGIGAALATLAPTLIGGALIGGFIALTSAMEGSKRKADELVASLKSQFDMETLSGLQGFVQATQRELDRLDEEWNNMIGTGNSWSAAIIQLGQNLSPFHANKIDENKRATKELREEQERAQTEALMWDHDLNTLSNTLGLSKTQVQGFLDEMDDWDPTNTAQTTGELADRIRTMALEAAHATPAASAMRNAIETMGDPTATAADRLKELDGVIDSLLGTMLAVSNAAIGFEEAIDGIADAVSEHGTTLDITSEAGREVAKSINSAAEAAIAHGQAVAQETGSVAAGVDVLKQHRQGLIDTMVQTGFSREAAEAYVATLGLTPENISTLVQLGGMEEAIFSQEQFIRMGQLVDAVKMNPRVNINSDEFDRDAIKIGTVLAQIGMAEPTAEVLLDGKKFTPTADQVMAWALTWDNSSPEAQAILNIIDPEDKFPTLMAAAQGWDAVVAEGTATVDNNQAKLGIAEAKDHMHSWDATTGTGDVNADNSDATNKMSVSERRLAAWNASRGTGDVLGNNADALSKISNAAGRLGSWDRSSGTSDVNAKDNASAVIRTILGLIGSLHDKTVTITTVHNNVSRVIDGRYVVRSGGIWGSGADKMGMIHAAAGTLQAGVLTSPAIFAGERETGGEAFIPRYGNPNRSRMILAQAADWYGMEMRPRGSSASGTGIVQDMRTHISVTVSAKSIMDGKTLVEAIRDTTRHELNEHDHKLLRSLKSR